VALELPILVVSVALVDATREIIDKFGTGGELSPSGSRFRGRSHEQLVQLPDREVRGVGV